MGEKATVKMIKVERCADCQYYDEFQKGCHKFCDQVSDPNTIDPRCLLPDAPIVEIGCVEGPWAKCERELKDARVEIERLLGILDEITELGLPTREKAALAVEIAMGAFVRTGEGRGAR